MSQYKKKEALIFITAAGKGTRMGELTKSYPKALLNLNGRPLVSYLCSYLTSKPASKEVVITYAKHTDKWMSFSKKYAAIQFKDYTQNPSIIFTLFNTAAYSDADNIIIINADTVFDFNLIDSTLLQHKSLGNDITVVLNKNNAHSMKRWEYKFNRNRDDLVDIVDGKTTTSIEKYFFIVKREVLKDFTNNFTLNMGLSEQDIYHKFRYFGKGCTCILKSLLSVGKYNMKAVFSQNYLFNINTPETLVEAETFFSQ